MDDFLTMGISGQFPQVRMRRNRQDAWGRSLVRETSLTVSDLVWPLFVREGNGVREAIPSLPGVDRLSIDLLVQAAQQAAELRIPAIAIFPVTDPNLKDPAGTEALNPENLVCRAVRAVRKLNLDLGIICDVALDPYTSHGHDGILTTHKPGSHLHPGTAPDVDNDATLEILAQQAVLQASAGCHVIAPSDMMDGRIGAVRAALDAVGHENVRILSYAAKYASSFYGPFRAAVGSASNLGSADKRTYQMDPANRHEALREVALDVSEGADWVMVKPGLPYLDIVSAVKDRFGLPTLAYQVSGEYAMLAHAAANGAIDLKSGVLESLLCCKRAGADAVFTYFAPQVAQWLKAG